MRPNAARLRSLLIVALLVLPEFRFASADEKPVRLWNSAGEVTDAYAANVHRLPPGTLLHLRQGQTARIVRFLGAGNTTVIYEIEGGKALRLAKGVGISDMGVAYDGYLAWFYEGMRKVSATETPAVKVYAEESWPTRYLVVEKLEAPTEINRIYSLEEVLAGEVEDTEMKRRMLYELEHEFAPRSWALRFVSDMRTDQLVYTRRGWIVADLTSTVRFAKATRDSTLFSSMGKLPISWRLRLEKRVFAKRELENLRGNFITVAMAEMRLCLNWFKGVVAF